MNCGRLNTSFATCLILAVLLTGCVSLPVTEGLGPGGAVIATDSTGMTINADGYRHLKGEGVPDTDFQIVPLGYHMTNSQWRDAHAIQLGQPKPAAIGKNP